MGGFFTFGGNMPAGMDGVRAYLRELRQLNNINQESMAKAIGLSRRALIDFEMGETDELKGSPLVRAVAYVKGSWDHVQKMIQEDSTAEIGRALADQQHRRLVEAYGSHRVEEEVRRLDEMSDEDLLSLISQASETLRRRR